MNYFLAVSLVSADHHINLSKITDICVKYGCNITQAKISLLGSVYAFHFLAQGLWHQISMLEQKLQNLEKKLKFKSVHTRTFEIWNAPHATSVLSYTIHVISADRPGILDKFLNLIHAEGLRIEETQLSTHTNHLGTPVLNLLCKINVDNNYSISKLREIAAEFAEEQNLDLFIEPTRY
ncbi:MAG: glycine cleavage system protein R [Gammaproteobacteria bacterium]